MNFKRPIVSSQEKELCFPHAMNDEFICVFDAVSGNGRYAEISFKNKEHELFYPGLLDCKIETFATTV